MLRWNSMDPLFSGEVIAWTSVRPANEMVSNNSVQVADLRRSAERNPNGKPTSCPSSSPDPGRGHTS